MAEDELHDEDSPMTREDLADFFQVHTRTVDLWCRQGRLRKIKVGPRAVHFRREDVAAYLELCETGSGNAP